MRLALSVLFIAAVQGCAPNSHEQFTGTMKVSEDFFEGLAVYEKSGKHGFVDSGGRVIIPARYEDGTGFSEGLASVRDKGKWGAINHYGDLVIPLEYEDSFLFCQGYACV